MTNPNPMDRHVGAAIRLHRKIKSLSQKDLGKILGVTFQQIQKYEKGVNRVGAGRLYEIAKALDVSVAHFFEGLEEGSRITEGVEEEGSPFGLGKEFTSEMIELWRAYTELKKSDRKHVLALVRALARKNRNDAETEEKS